MKLQCNHCKTYTSHAVTASHRVHSEPEEDVQWTTTYRILTCKGCETFTFSIEASNSEDYDPDTGDEIVTYKYYPPRNAGREPIAGCDQHLPKKLIRIYKEVLAALNHGMPLLAGIGLRTLIEALCNNQKAVGNDLKQKIDSMATKGVIAEKQAELLHKHRFLGNVAAHEVQAADPHELVAATDIAETMIKTIYILPVVGNTIKTGAKSAKNLTARKQTRAPAKIAVPPASVASTKATPPQAAVQP